MHKGLSEPIFRKRFQKHHSDFRNIRCRDLTSLSNLLQKFKEQGIDYEIKWSINEIDREFNTGEKCCHLYISEKWHIMKSLSDGRHPNRQTLQLVGTTTGRQFFYQLTINWWQLVDTYLEIQIFLTVDVSTIWHCLKIRYCKIDQSPELVK